MKYQMINGFKISALGLGCYSLSGAYGQKNPQSFTEVIRFAYEEGINFFDTADTYGESAEEILGEAVKPFRHEVYLATKVGIREGIRPNLNKEYVIQACENSLKRLNTERIDLYQIHFDDPSTPVSDTLSALEELVKQGKIRKYGLGHLSMARIHEYNNLGEPFSVLFELSAVARDSLHDVLPYCRKNNLASIAFSITGRGVLTGKIKKDVTFEPGDIRVLDPLFQRERFQSTLRITDAFTKIGQRFEKTPVQVAINWVLVQQGISCALTGASTVSHLKENLGGCGWRLDKKSLNQINHILSQENERVQSKEREILQNLLSNKLKPDPTEAFLDLVYIIETAVQLKIVSEDALYPVFLDLFQFRDELGLEILPKLEEFHHLLQEEIAII